MLLPRGISKVFLALVALGVAVGLSGCVQVEPGRLTFTANGQVRDATLVSDEVGEVKILEQKITVGANFFEITQSCAGKGVVVVDPKKPQTCVAKVKSKNFAAGVTGKLYTKYEYPKGPAVAVENNLAMK